MNRRIATASSISYISAHEFDATVIEFNEQENLHHVCYMAHRFLKLHNDFDLIYKRKLILMNDDLIYITYVIDKPLYINKIAYNNYCWLY